LPRWEDINPMLQGQLMQAHHGDERRLRTVCGAKELDQEAEEVTRHVEREDEHEDRPSRPERCQWGEPASGYAK